MSRIGSERWLEFLLETDSIQEIYSPRSRSQFECHLDLRSLTNMGINFMASLCLPWIRLEHLVCEHFSLHLIWMQLAIWQLASMERSCILLCFWTVSCTPSYFLSGMIWRYPENVKIVSCFIPDDKFHSSGLLRASCLNYPDIFNPMKNKRMM